MRKSSHSPGCMRRLPASHSCHPRRVQLISAAAAVCESPAASRAARTSAGAGFAEGPFGPRFGWLGIYFFSDDFGRLFKLRLHVGFALVASHLRGEIAGFLGGGGFDKAEFARICSYVKGGHFWLLPQYPRRGGQQRAAHELNSTRIACNCKSFLHKVIDALTPSHNTAHLSLHQLSTKPSQISGK